MSKKQEELTDNLNEFIHDSAENSQLPKRVSGDHNAASWSPLRTVLSRFGRMDVAPARRTNIKSGPC
jgi:hypothetical protein